MERPETRYVAVGDADVAYQVVGEGPVDLLLCFGLGNHIELFWQSQEHVEFFARLASFSRLIMLDRRGTGASDGIPLNAIPTWEEWTEDIRSVLDEVGSRQTAMLAMVDSGPLAILFAALYPERVSALILVNTLARYMKDDDYPMGVTSEEADVIVETLATGWGTPHLVQLANPSTSYDPEHVRFLAMVLRSSVTPRTASAQWKYMLRSLDVRQALPLVQAPTRVLHVRESAFLPLEYGRYIAENIPGASLVELPGGDTGFSGEIFPVIADEVATFLTGEKPVVEVERILTTVLFTDIVGSTERASSLGDRRWRSLLDTHDRTVRDQLRRFRGREINTTGDGFVASFDGPARAIRCAKAMIEATGKLGMELRVGLHTGECEVRGDDLGGLAVHIAARVGALAGPGEVLVSRTVVDLVAGSGIEFEDRGEYELKGVPGEWRLFTVEN